MTSNCNPVTILRDYHKRELIHCCPVWYVILDGVFLLITAVTAAFLMNLESWFSAVSCSSVHHLSSCGFTSRCFHLHDVFSSRMALTRTGSALPLVSLWTWPISLFSTFLFPFLMAWTYTEAQETRMFSFFKNLKTNWTNHLKHIMDGWPLTSFGWASTTFWQMLCSLAVSLTIPRSRSLTICAADLSPDVHIFWNTCQ